MRLSDGMAVPGMTGLDERVWHEFSPILGHVTTVRTHREEYINFHRVALPGDSGPMT